MTNQEAIEYLHNNIIDMKGTLEDMKPYTDEEIEREIEVEELAIAALQRQEEVKTEKDLISRVEVLKHIEEIECSDLPKNYGTLLDILYWLRYTLPCAYNYNSVMKQLDGAAITRFEGRLKDGRICHYEDIKYIVRTGGELPK